MRVQHKVFGPGEVAAVARLTESGNRVYDVNFVDVDRTVLTSHLEIVADDIQPDAVKKPARKKSRPKVEPKSLNRPDSLLYEAQKPAGLLDEIDGVVDSEAGDEIAAVAAD
jgi:hypothetical protein